jgi:hypothetical protein
VGPFCGKESEDMKKRTLVALVAGLAVFASTFAFAATLGGLTSGEVGANNVLVAACDTDGVSTSYSGATWDATDERYEVGSVTVSGINNACDGDVLKVTLADSGGAQLSEGTLNPIPTDGAVTSYAVSLSAAVAATSVENVHVVIGS